jgi:glutamate/tyrosine decarboxylase-like PLP-dependent enzyme
VLAPYLTTLQWSRRFMGLRLFLSLAAAGWQGYAVHVERAVALIEELARLLAARGWRVRNEPRLAVLCATPPAGSAPVRLIVQRVLRSGNAWVAATRFEGEDTVRICATHGESSEQDLQLLIAALEQARAVESN